MPKYSYTVEDRCEGIIHGTVTADSEDEALEEAEIAAAENGCRNIGETIVEEQPVCRVCGTTEGLIDYPQGPNCNGPNCIAF